MLQTESGFIMGFEENVNPESPTYGLLTLIDYMKRNKDYYERMSACGYDISCGVYKRCKTLFSKKIIRDINVKSIIATILPISYIPKFHAKGHKKDICKHKDGVGYFHPKLTKFKQVLTNITDSSNEKADKDDCNGEIVEQTWKQWNKLRFMFGMNKRSFNWTMLQWKLLYNKRNMMRLKHKGFRFVPIGNVLKIRSFETNSDMVEFPDKKDMIANVQKAKLSDTSIQIAGQTRLLDQPRNRDPKRLRLV